MGRWARTHQSLQDAALQLFADYGYDAIPAAQVAAAAGVTEMTLFRHFPTKSALVLQDPFDPLIAEAVRTRPGDEPPVRAVAEAIRQAWGHISPQVVDALRTRLTIIAASATLAGALDASTRATTAAISQALTDRDVPPDAAAVAAAAVISGLTVALLHWARADDGDLPSALHRALDVLAGSGAPGEPNGLDGPGESGAVAGRGAAEGPSSRAGGQ